MDRKKIALSLVGLVVVVVGCAYWLFRGNDPAVKSASVLKTIKGEAVDLVVRSGPSLVGKTVSKDNQDRGQLWSLVQPKGSKQEFVIDANYEQGDSLKKLTGFTKQSLRDSVVANINVQLPKQYPEYKELTQRNLTVNGFEANETVFEYTTSGIRAKQRLLLLFKNSDTAVYIRAQAKLDEYREINERYFEPIFSSAKFE